MPEEFTNFSEILGQAVLGQELKRYIISFGIILATLVIRKIFDGVIAKQLGKWTKKTRFKYDDILIDSLMPPISAFILCSGVFLAILSFKLPIEPYNIPQFLTRAFHAATGLIAVWAAYRLCDLISAISRMFFLKQDSQLAEQFTPLVRQASRATVLIFGGILIIQNLGYSVSSLLAGLGIGGLAVALAAQDTVSNIFGTFVMFTDKPFSVGDWIQFGEVDGIVETIGFRSFRVRSWEQTELIIPNKMITSEVVENLTRRDRRRIKMTIGVEYSTPADKVKELCERIEQALKNDDDVNQEFMQVKFTGFGDSALEILVYYFTKSTDLAGNLETRERLNFEMMNIAAELGLSFAFPSRTIYFGDTLKTSLPS